MRKLIISITFFLLISHFYTCSVPATKHHWKGSAILGNGEICVVYSDDERLDKTGIQHFYFKDFTADYISSSSCDFFVEDGSKISGEKSISLTNFYTTSTVYNSEEKIFEVQAHSLPDIGLILTLINKNKQTDNSSFNYKIHFRKNIITDRQIHLEQKMINSEKSIIKWSNGVSLSVASNAMSNSMTFADSILTIKGNWNTDSVHIIFSAFDDTNKKIAKNKKPNSNYWNAWLETGLIPEFENEIYTEYFKRNLYAARAANLIGMIPADITGQFVTNNMPQLYPRDAMMTARVFVKTGHLEEAKQVIRFWTDKKIPRKSPGEWYARYDANGKAVDAGSGARYDEPEWDANGYYIQLLEMLHNKTGEWLVDSLQIYEVADFLVNNIDENDLLFEGGIIEWSGYLPATNMTAVAALQTSAKIANEFGNTRKANLYKKTSSRISSNLNFIFDNKRKTYADVRFAAKKNKDNSSVQDAYGDTLYLWDTSANFGILS
jgi:GH15 family glucan-1,4-alpha-glucosidase